MKSRQYSYLIVALVCLALLYPGRVLAQSWFSATSEKETPSEKPSEFQEIPTDQLILKYKRSQERSQSAGPMQADQLQRLSEAGGVSLSYAREMSGEAHVLRLTDRMPKEQVEAIAQRLMALPEVEYAEADAIMQHTLVPNDPGYPNQWHYFAPTPGSYGINASEAWDITTGAASVVVAVLDTGITNHAEFSGRTVPGYDFISNITMANDGNGRDSDPSDPGDWTSIHECFFGWPGSDSSWHGTHTAGTIGAASNNNSGVAGVNWVSKILPVRVLGRCGGFSSDIVDGMRWAAGLSVSGVPNNPNPAKVLNLSLGGSSPCSPIYQNAINDIIAAGSTVVVSAGNSNADASGYSPAGCNGVITVAATDRDGFRASYSNFGSVVEISAPGGDTNPILTDGVLSTLNTGAQGPVADSYEYYQGTSMSAPHVSGVASLLYSLEPTITPAQVLYVLQNTVTNFPGGSTCNTANCGSGIVNAGAAVEMVDDGLPDPPDPPEAPSCTNLLADPSFEAYTPNPSWVEASTNFSTPLCTTAICGSGGGTAGPRTGTVWGWFGGTSSNESASLEQDVFIPYGSTSLSFYLWIGNAPAGSGPDDVFTAKIDSTTLFSADATEIGSYSSYTRIELDATSFANAASHTIRFSSSTSGQAVNFNLDDVNLCQTSITTYIPVVLR